MRFFRTAKYLLNPYHYLDAFIAHCPGDTLNMAVQVNTPLTYTGLYNWQVQVKIDYSGAPSAYGTITGSAAELVEDSNVAGQVDPYGAGWGITGIDRLVPVSGGVIWVYGNGTSAFFASAGGGSFTTPVGVFGTLSYALGVYTYTEDGVIQETFNSAGLLTTAVTTDNLERDYTYNLEDELTQVVAGDGGITDLDYDDDDFLEAIEEPGGRTLSIDETEAGGIANLSEITDAAGLERDFTYNASNQLITDDWDPYDTTLGYAPGTGALTEVNLGAGSVYDIAAAAPAPLHSSRKEFGDIQGSFQLRRGKNSECPGFSLFVETAIALETKG